MAAAGVRSPIADSCALLLLFVPLSRDGNGSLTQPHLLGPSRQTAAFALPLLERLLYRPRRVAATRVLILTPTRELAVQVHSMIEKLAQFSSIRACLVVGGLSSKVQESALRTHPDIVVATPGRMIDLLQNAQSVGLEDLAILVLDEADRLLEMGFATEVHELVRMCPRKRQTLLFSATMTEEVAELVRLSLDRPVRLSADPTTMRPVTLVEEVVKVKPAQAGQREAMLLALCARSFTHRTIVFCGTKVEAHRLKLIFGLAGLKAAELHGNLTQAMRLEALETFRRHEADFLLATDVAARGLDIPAVETVLNFECPQDITTYVHRVGRTARAGNRGCAVTFIGEKDRALVKAMAKRAGRQLHSRVLAPAAIAKWQATIEAMEEDIAAILREEREEMALRKAEMEANKAQNMVEHEAEIYARPKKTWFQSNKERRATMTAAKAKGACVRADQAVKDKRGDSVKEAVVTSANSAKELRMKEKRRLEKEKSLPRKKRRRLEAAREVADEERAETAQEGETLAKKKKIATLEEVGYMRARAAKSVEKQKRGGLHVLRVDAKSKKVKKRRPEERQKTADEDVLKIDADIRPKTTSNGSGPKSRPLGSSRKAFKSKARYKRR
eukprot:SM000057S18388  [mRNA]  locus=s57:291437:296607:+ [translate_table: standard]